jgi:hypothetical protein
LATNFCRQKTAIETAHAELKTAFEAKDADAIKTKTEALDAAWMALQKNCTKQLKKHNRNQKLRSKCR